MKPAPCPDAELQSVVAMSRADALRGIGQTETLLAHYADDARLQFLYGSLLAGALRYDEAVTAMIRAIGIEPGFVLARFQLGFLQLTCARPEAATQTWLPLLLLPEDDPFKLFALGLGHLIRDEFEATIGRLEAGMARNDAHPLVNNDMQLIVDEVRKLVARNAGQGEREAAMSETQLLFERYAVHDTSAYRH